MTFKKEQCLKRNNLNFTGRGCKNLINSFCFIFLLTPNFLFAIENNYNRDSSGNESQQLRETIQAKILNLRLKYAEAQKAEAASYLEMTKAKTFSNLSVVIFAGSAALIKFGLEYKGVHISSVTDKIIPTIIRHAALYKMTVESSKVVLVSELYTANKFVNHYVTEWKNKLLSDNPAAQNVVSGCEFPLFLLNLVSAMESPLIALSAFGNSLTEEVMAQYSVNHMIDNLSKHEIDFENVYRMIDERRLASKTEVSKMSNVLSLGFKKRFATQSTWEANLLEKMARQYEYHYYANLYRKFLK